MYHSLGIIALLLCIISSSHALDKPKFSKDITIVSPNSLTLPLGNHLYTVSKNRSHVTIDSTTDKNYNPCTIRVDPFDDFIRGKMRASAHDGEIFVWGERSKQFVGMATKYSNYTLLLLNPKTCNYLSATIGEQDDMPAVSEQLPEIVNYDGKFDVFFPSLKKCSPCRYNQWGVRYGQSEQPLNKLKAEEPHSVSFHIRWMDPGYFYVFNFENGTSVIRYLDREFFTLKEKYVDHTVDAISNTIGKTKNVGVCYKRAGLKDTELFCTKLNSQLASLDFFHVPVSKSESVSSMSFEYDDKGNSFVGLAEFKQYKVFIYDKDAQLIASLDFGKAAQNFLPSEVHGYVVGNEYCLVVDESQLDAVAAQRIVKCIDIKKYTTQH